MSEKSKDSQELSQLYQRAFQQLNAAATPDWLQLDLTFQQMKVLYIIRQFGSLTMSELHEHLQVSMPTITGIVNRLIERRNGTPLLVRETSPEDRREVRASLTDAGLEVTNMVGALKTAVLQEVFNTMSEEELRITHKVFNRFCELSEQQRHNVESNGGKKAEPVEDNNGNRRKRRRLMGVRETANSNASSITSNHLRFDSYSTRPILTS
ncbi:MAG: MarR family transcriptional regulator [Chloroflexi bacterium]|uniref:MarR family transcriptional regulator n=1 Tax=Candidatus Chlorohelix allophototropha TaxID=3003348 RepID=A0A8T7LVA3_9CHLR|nr:MarR family transcriptional regulator [Chloroflexota bacterium]WJW67819.1 MarR family transcriptional regulator [Chloroflexota bacterium L227-S17]